ncbi:DUF6924 domain-containing protein [Micromonospora sp. DT227]|uniref:DUF6924 domain-containing protein n=1 Tax=Micromonospora sp. DT227 TaxID=3393433 RepID=UPI003CE7C0BE
MARADFTDDAVWSRIRQWIAEPTEEGFGADVDFVEDRALDGMDDATIIAGFLPTYPHEYRHLVLFVIDAVHARAPCWISALTPGWTRDRSGHCHDGRR